MFTSQIRIMLHTEKSMFLTVFFLFLPCFVALEEVNIPEYNADNFRKQIEKMDGNFIMFYAPWCRHCTDFYPVWQELAELINTKGSKFAIAQVDCTVNSKLCQENDITGYPMLLYFHKNSFTPIEYKGTRDLPSLTLFLSEVFTMKKSPIFSPNKMDSDVKDDPNEVTIYSGMAYLTDQNIEKFVSDGQHFIMFYAPWCKASQRFAPTWAELGVQYNHNMYVQIGKVNCLENEITCKNFDIKQYPSLLWIVNGRIMGSTDIGPLSHLKEYVEKMMIAENHDPDKFIKKKEPMPVVRISEVTFESSMQKDLVFVNYFAPWCAHCMQLSPLWLKLGETFQNETNVLIADVDCAKTKDICEMENVEGLPTLILYKHRRIVSVERGGRPLESLVALVNEHLRGVPQPHKEPSQPPEEPTQPPEEPTQPPEELPQTHEEPQQRKDPQSSQETTPKDKPAKDEL